MYLSDCCEKKYCSDQEKLFEISSRAISALLFFYFLAEISQIYYIFTIKMPIRTNTWDLET